MVYFEEVTNSWRKHNQTYLEHNQKNYINKIVCTLMKTKLKYTVTEKCKLSKKILMACQELTTVECWNNYCNLVVILNEVEHKEAVKSVL